MSRARFRWVHALVMVGLFAGHAALVHYFEPFEWLASDEPISLVDFDTHAEQTWRVIEGLEGWGQSWVYDVQLLAGFPNGTIFDADNKLWELWTYTLYRAGLPKALGFNSFVFLAHLLLVPWLFLSARTFGLGPGSALLAAALGSLLWFFDSYTHWYWWIGTLAYDFAAYFYLLPLALFYRFALDGKLWRAALTALLMTLGHLLHPYTFFVMVIPMSIIYASAFRRLSRLQHAAVFGIAVSVVLGNAYWLKVAFAHWHYILNSAFYGQSEPVFALADFLNVLLDVRTTGYIGTRTGFRWLALGLALGTLYFWRKSADPRYRLFAGGLAAMYLLIYVAPVVVPVVGQIQPYRFIVSAMFLSVIPAAECIVRIWRERRAIVGSTVSRLAFALLSVSTFQHLASDVLYFFPGLLPDVPKVIEAPLQIAAMGYPPHVEYRHLKPWQIDRRLDEWVDAHAHEGRIAVPDLTAERLAWKTRAQLLGGFVEINLSHARAHPKRWIDHGRPNAAQLREFIETYAVSYFIVRFDDFGLPEHSDVVEFHAEVGGATIYRAIAPANFFAQGRGRVVAETNRLTITETDPTEGVVLKYHWHEALRCKPDCRLLRVPHPRDEVGFIAVPAPHPANFVIENSYTM